MALISNSTTNYKSEVSHLTMWPVDNLLLNENKPGEEKVIDTECYLLQERTNPTTPSDYQWFSCGEAEQHQIQRNLTSCTTMYSRSCTGSNRKTPQRIVNTAGKIISVSLNIENTQFNSVQLY